MPRRLISTVLLLFLAGCLGAGYFELSEGRVHELAPLTPEGEALLGELNCVACHAAEPAVALRLAPHTAPLLEGVGARISPRYLERFLADPQSVQPGTRMPDLIAAMPGFAEKSVVRAFVHYLASLGGPFDGASRTFPTQVLDEGRRLYHRVGCVACHEPEVEREGLEWSYWDWEAVPEQTVLALDAQNASVEEEEETWVAPGVLPPAAVPLGDLARKTNVDSLARFLRDPLSVRPAGRMPSLLLSEDEALAIAVYLLREQTAGDGVRATSAPGLAYEYFEGDFCDDVADYGAHEPARLGSVSDFGELPDHREDHFGFRFRGQIDVPARGTYTFFTTSDDGSLLLVDGELVVDNGGVHSMVEVSGSVHLEAGLHALEVSMFECAGGQGLEVLWEGPGIEKGPIPGELLTQSRIELVPDFDPEFEVDPKRAAKGGRFFRSFGCAGCHAGEEPAAPPEGVPALAELDPDAGGGCLSLESAGKVPYFALAAEEVESMRAVLRSSAALAEPLSLEEDVARTLGRMRCTTCHRRNEVGGPHPERQPYFQVIDAADLGDQGRFPPHLERVGAKLRRHWIEAVMLEGEGQRPYMATRMPQFGAQSVGHLVDHFVALDSPGDEEEPGYDAELIAAGHRLAGTDGLGCIQCHRFAGHPSLGVPAVDLAYVHERTKPAWFKELLLDPGALSMNTRMPEFWENGKSPVKDVFDGDPKQQIDALWAYLSLGESMYLPAGLVVPDRVYEVEPLERLRMVGVFWEGASARTLVVGTRAQTHYAFDVESSRLLTAWRGRFFNGRGTWHARAGQLERPPTNDVFDFPDGPPLAFIDEGEAWPSAVGRAAGMRALGRTVGRHPHRTITNADPADVVSFRYSVGDLTVTESILPTSGGLARHFAVRGPGSGVIWLRAAAGRVVSGPLVDEFQRYFEVDGAIVKSGFATARVRQVPGGAEVLVPIDLSKPTSRATPATHFAEVVYQW